ncbi:MAG: ATP synthase F1 subunit delta [Patescibacteria group bacterium]
MSLPRQIREVSRALIEVATEKGVVAEVILNLKQVNSALLTSPDIAVSLQDQSVPLIERQEALQTALKDAVHIFVKNALLELQRLQLLNHLSSFTEAATSYAKSLTDYQDAVIYSAVKLEEEEKKRIKKILNKKFGGEVGFEERLEPGILGGLIIEAGDWRFDSSLKEQINQLKQHISA